MHDLDTTLESDLLRAELVSLPLALLVLLWVFRTAVAAALPVGVGALSVVGGIAIVLGLSHLTDIAQYTINVCSLIGLGVAIDYSLFTVSRYREELGHGHELSRRGAAAAPVATAGRVVVFSGIAVGTGLAGLLFFEGSYLASIGVSGAIVVALAVVFSLTFLPALLAVLGPRIHAGKLPGRRRAPSEERAGLLAPRRDLGDGAAGASARSDARCLAPPRWRSFFLHLRLAAADVRVLSAPTSGRRAPRSTTPFEPPSRTRRATRITVAVEFPSAPALTPERVAAIYDLSHRIAAMPGVRKVESLTDNGQPLPKEQAVYLLLNPPPEARPMVEMAKALLASDRVVLVHAVTDAAPESVEAREIVHAIRSARRVGDGTLLVAGATANDLDATAYILHRTPYAIGLVVGATFIVCWLSRSVGSMVCIKAVVMNVTRRHRRLVRGPRLAVSGRSPLRHDANRARSSRACRCSCSRSCSASRWTTRS